MVHGATNAANVQAPELVRQAPETVVEAQFSIPYTVASAWMDGTLGLSHFTDEGLKRADILDLAKRVQPYVDEELNRERGRGVTQAKVSIRFRDGQMIEARVDDAKGHPKNPMTDADFLAKAEDCARVAAKPMATDAGRRLASAVAHLESADTIADLMRAII